jgi:glycerate 2-kinase
VTSIATELASAGLFVTGEGRIDAQSTEGKVTGFLLDAGAAAGVPVPVIAGSVAIPVPDRVTASADLAILASDSAAAIADPTRWLCEGRRHLARLSTKDIRAN